MHGPAAPHAARLSACTAQAGQRATSTACLPQAGVSAGGLRPASRPPLPPAEPLLLRDVLPAGTPVTITLRKGRCAALLSYHPRPPAAGRKQLRERNPCQAAAGSAALRSLGSLRDRARRSARRAPAGPSSDLPSVTRRAPSLADKAALSALALGRPALGGLTDRLYITAIMQTWHGFLRATPSSRLRPPPPQRGLPPGASRQPPPETATFVDAVSAPRLQPLRGFRSCAPSPPGA